MSGRSKPTPSGGESAADLVKQAIEFIRDRVDVDIDFDKAARGASDGYRARQKAGPVSALTGAITGALRSGGIQISVREEPSAKPVRRLTRGSGA
jgi:hypothetical protein